jgi:phage/plasmid-like protein (TIGR03299 family)
MTDVKFSAREVPWMKLGKIIDEQSVDATKAAQLGGLDFQVEERPCLYPSKTGEVKNYEDRKVLVRTDTDEPLSVVAKTYPVLQYSEAFDYLNALSPQFVAAGALKGGKQGFMVVKLPETQCDVLDGQDPHTFYGVLRTSMDRTRAVEMSMMALRGMCMNQLTLNTFQRGARLRWSVTHTSSMHAKLADAQHSLKLMTRYAESFNTLVEELASIKLNREQAELALRTAKIVKKGLPKENEVYGSILDKFEFGDHVGSMFHRTGWGLVQGVSEYFDWGRKGGNPESRFLAALQGPTHAAINTTTAYILDRWGDKGGLDKRALAAAN